MEAAFKTKMNATVMRKKMAKFGLPNCKWSKAPKLDIHCTYHFKCFQRHHKTDNASHKAQKLWLKAATPLAAIVNKVDTGVIEETGIIQEIRNALLLLGNASQQHSLQQWKMILQHLNLQLKLLVQDAEFTEVPPICLVLILERWQRYSLKFPTWSSHLDSENSS